MICAQCSTCPSAGNTGLTLPCHGVWNLSGSTLSASLHKQQKHSMGIKLCAGERFLFSPSSEIHTVPPAAQHDSSRQSQQPYATASIPEWCLNNAHCVTTLHA